MDKNLKNLNKGLYEIKTALLANEEVRKLLFYDQKDALEKTAPEISDVKDYIGFFPITESGITDYKKNTFIAITVPKLDTDLQEKENIYFGFYLTVISKKDVWELNDNKVRIISLCDEIIKALDGKKISFPTPLEVVGMQQIVYDASTCGYVVKVFAEDMQKKVTF